MLLSACSTQQTQSVKDQSWCTRGTAYGEQGISSTIEGIAQFKGSDFCKAKAVLTAEGATLEYTYYFNEDGSDIWVLVTASGETTETHLTR